MEHQINQFPLSSFTVADGRERRRLRVSDPPEVGGHFRFPARRKRKKEKNSDDFLADVFQSKLLLSPLASLCLRNLTPLSANFIARLASQSGISFLLSSLFFERRTLKKEKERDRSRDHSCCHCDVYHYSTTYIPTLEVYCLNSELASVAMQKTKSHTHTRTRTYWNFCPREEFACFFFFGIICNLL